jgi:fibronectin type 3 domain-containing protein
MRLLATVLLISLAGCGYVGPPLPPALYIPQRVMDLRAEVIGEEILVHFTAPTLTTEDLPATELRAITLYIGPSEREFSRDRWAASAQRYTVAVNRDSFELPAAAFAGQQLVLSLRTTGRTGRESDWSTYAYLTVAPPLTPPANVVSRNLPDAVSLTWSGNAPRYRIARIVEGKAQPLAETDAPEYVDHAIVYGMNYEYVIVGLAGDKQQSLPSVPIAVTPADEFPPAIPSGLTAVATGSSVDLSWTRSADDDLAAYNVFRAIGDGLFEPLTRVLLPAYVDTRVEAGKRYRYKVSATDTTGNESDRSTEAVAQVE